MGNAALGYTWTGAVAHCTGSVVAYGAARHPVPHHGHALYAPCWSCRQPLGCDRCAGVVTEVLCVRCCAWGTPEAFAHHGAILNTPSMLAKRKGRRAPQFAAYPPDFQRAYREAIAAEEALAPPRQPSPEAVEMVEELL